MTINLETFRGGQLAEFFLPCRAYPLKRGRTRSRKYKGVYQPLGDQQHMMELLEPHMGLLINCPTIVEIYCQYQPLYRRNHRRTDIAILSYDVDNIAKAVLDNLQRMRIIDDDRNVVGVTALKYAGPCDSTTIKIFKAEGYKHVGSQTVSE